MDELLENLQIRKIKAEDASDISQIQSAITKSSPTIDFRQIIEQQVRKDEDVSFVAEVDGRVVGYMISYIVFGGFGLEKGAWIATLGVAPKFMGQGIGKRLAEEILEVYRKKGINDIFTSVRWDSVDLLSFFKTLGFDRSSFINLRKELDS
ncbi:MAG: GNAT family N-acetyltransferase [Desulfobacteraceae bacterium]|nr:GNAT family N-acetyltransferase [Desulfobacteraceae bacterium]